MKKLIVLGLMVFVSLTGFTQVQLPDSCKLEMGINVAGLADYASEIPFVDLMHTARVWYTKSIGDPIYYFDSGFADELSYREDGYPTHLPQMVDSSAYPQIVATIWAITDAWPAGQYTVLWEGTGTLDFIGPFQNLQQTNPHRIVFDYPTTIDGALEMRIETSDSLDPIHNIRVLMPGTEFTYESQPFYQLWLDKVNVFNTVRFMGWEQTNNWGLNNDDGYGDSLLVDWDGRSKMDHYTWAYNKGVPFEMIVKYMNENDKDGWVCIPHSASEDFVRNMARYFRDNLEPDRHIFVEYSNEIWNWIFAQTNWAYKYGCLNTGVPWPEGTVPYIQRALDYWTEEYAGQLDRTTRVVGVFTAWLDVAQRVAFNLDPNSFDAISPTFYFSFVDLLEEELDSLGANATVSDVAQAARLSQPANFEAIRDIKELVADSLGKPMVFYEGGQHLTPHPFGVMPTYEQALLDIQRDTSMYNLYNEWLDMIRTLQEGEAPLLLMNFAFVGARSAQYGSWGILETMDQNLSVVPAPKYQAILENMNTNCQMVATESPNIEHFSISLEPNPTSDRFVINGPDGDAQVSIFDVTGVLRQKVAIHPGQSIDVRFLPKGMYFVSVNRQVLKLMIY